MPTQAAPHNSKTSLTVYVLQALLACAFLTAAIAQLAGNRNIVGIFETIGFGQWLLYLAALFEIAGATLLLTRTFSAYAAVAMATLMLVAAVLGMASQSSSLWLLTNPLLAGIPIVPNVLLLACLVVAWYRRDQFDRLLA